MGKCVFALRTATATLPTEGARNAAEPGVRGSRAGCTLCFLQHVYGATLVPAMIVFDKVFGFPPVL